MGPERKAIVAAVGGEFDGVAFVAVVEGVLDAGGIERRDSGEPALAARASSRRWLRSAAVRVALRVMQAGGMTGSLTVRVSWAWSRCGGEAE